MQKDRHNNVLHKMTSTPKRRGIVQTDRGRTKNIPRDEKSISYFIMWIGYFHHHHRDDDGKISEVKEFIMNLTSGYLVYDIEADYTSTIIALENEDVDKQSITTKPFRFHRIFTH